MVNKFTTKITDKKQLSENTFVLSLDCGKLDFKAGQFITFILKDKEGKIKPRSYSLLNAPSREPTQLLVEFIKDGVAGEAFKTATKDTEVTVRGPLGVFYFQKDKKKHVFIVTNTGLAPVHSMISEHLDKDYEMTLIFGAKKLEGLYFHEDFVAVDKSDKSFTYKPTLSRETIPGIAQGYVQKLIEFDQESQYYICGSPAMVKDSIKVLEKNNVPKENIHYEIF